jgi:histidine triad (HIT) family protein
MAVFRGTLRAMDSCLFCDIRDGKRSARKVFEDDACLAFEDIQPQAPTHVLFIPRLHIPTVNELTPETASVLGRLFLAAAKVAKERGLAERGYRVVVNTNREANQTVFHLHLHLIGGRSMGWPPG